MFTNFREFISVCLRRIFQIILNIQFNIILKNVKKTQRDEISQVSIGQSGLCFQKIKELKVGFENEMFIAQLCYTVYMNFF
jgi:hypothetical protein